MNTNDPRFELIRRCRDGEASAEDFTQLESSLREDADFLESYIRYTNLDVALGAMPTVVVYPLKTEISPRSNRNAWLAWRPLSAAAAGLVLGMFCTSMVFGFVSHRLAVSKKLPLAVYEPGMENAEAVLGDGFPHQIGQWGVDSAAVVSTENGVQPCEGKRMLRLEPIPREKEVKNHTSRVYQVLDLGSLPMRGIVDDAEVKITASFFAANADVSSRYLIRAVALIDTPEQATKDFWSKTENDDVVSVSQRFDAPSGERGWHTFSLKIPLPRGMQSLVIILGAVPPADESAVASVHYLDDVNVSVLTSTVPNPYGRHNLIDNTKRKRVVF